MINWHAFFLKEWKERKRVKKRNTRRQTDVSRQLIQKSSSFSEMSMRATLCLPDESDYKTSTKIYFTAAGAYHSGSKSSIMQPHGVQPIHNSVLVNRHSFTNEIHKKGVSGRLYCVRIVFLLELRLQKAPLIVLPNSLLRDNLFSRPINHTVWKRRKNLEIQVAQRHLERSEQDKK